MLLFESLKKKENPNELETVGANSVSGSKQGLLTISRHALSQGLRVW
jgi:hypothetical protein